MLYTCRVAGSRVELYISGIESGLNLSSSQLRRAREAINVLSSLSDKLIGKLTPLNAAMQGSSYVY